MKIRIPRLFWRLPSLVRFIPVYLWEMTLSNLRIAADALRPQPRFEPGFLRVSVLGYGAAQWWQAASLISMTPGTLSVDLDEDSQTLLVHTLYLHDPDVSRQSLEKLLHQALGNPNPPSP